MYEKAIILFSEIIQFLNGIIWNILPFLLIFAAIYFTFKTKFIQVRHFTRMFKLIFAKGKDKEHGISSFGAFCTSVAGRVGTGNLVGIAMAIKTGGPGSVFWMWLVALFSMSTAFIESTLAQVYKVNENDGTYRGGPAYYIEKALNCRWLGVVFSILLLITFGLVFNSVQANSISNAVNNAFGLNKIVVTAALAIFTSFIIFGGIKRITHVAEVIVPIMALGYLIVVTFVIVTNFNDFINSLKLIFESAFGIKQVTGGVIGYSVKTAITKGIQRGLFSNEAGMGSAPNVAAAAEVKHPAVQGFVQMLGVFTDTIIICSATATLIILSGEYNSELNGIELTQAALVSKVGPHGATFIAVALFFFAFTSIIANYYLGETSMRFLDKSHPNSLLIYRIIVLIMIFFGGLNEAKLIWDMADVTSGLLAFINIIAIILLGKVAIKVLFDYERELKSTNDPVFKKENFPEIAEKLEPGIWE